MADHWPYSASHSTLAMRIPPEISKKLGASYKVTQKQMPPSGKAFKSESMNGNFFRTSASRLFWHLIFIDVNGKISDEFPVRGTIICALLFEPYFYA